MLQKSEADELFPSEREQKEEQRGEDLFLLFCSCFRDAVSTDSIVCLFRWYALASRRINPDFLFSFSAKG